MTQDVSAGPDSTEGRGGQRAPEKGRLRPGEGGRTL